MPLNLPSQNSLFFEREVICQSSIIQHWPHRHGRAGAIDRWHIITNINALRSMRAAQLAYDAGQLSIIGAKTKTTVHRTGRTGSRRRKSHG